MSRPSLTDLMNLRESVETFIKILGETIVPSQTTRIPLKKKKKHRRHRRYFRCRKPAN